MYCCHAQENLRAVLGILLEMQRMSEAVHVMCCPAALDGLVVLEAAGAAEGCCLHLSIAELPA